MKLFVPTAAVLAVVAIATVSAQAPPVQQDGGQPPRGQQAAQYPDGEKVWTTVPIHTAVLPKDASVQQLADIMTEWRAAIGGHCITCHTVTTDSSNKNAMGNPEIMPYDGVLPDYKASEQMYLLTQEINKKLISSAMAPVTCGTCHRGKLKPEAFVIPASQVPSPLPAIQIPSKQLTPAQPRNP
jgi:hypothetical protein